MSDFMMSQVQGLLAKVADDIDKMGKTTYAQTESELTTARVGTVDRAGTEMELDRQTYTRNDGEQPTQVAQAPATPAPAAEPMPAATAPAATPAPAATDMGTRARSLPRTASSLPVIALAGLMAFGASLAFRALGSRA